MFCTQCGKEIREGFKFCTNCGAAVKGGTVKIEPKTTVTETPVIIKDPNEFQESKTENAPVAPKGEKKLPVGLIILIIFILCGAFWFLGGRDLIIDVVGISDSKKTTGGKGNLHIENEEETEDDSIDDIEEIEDSEDSLETAEAPEYNNAELEAPADVGEVMNPAIDELIEEEEEIEEPSEYIIENSDTRYLTKEDLVGLTEEECRLARNELYARHGRKFDDEMLQSYFDACSWYHGTINASDFQESMLSDIEIANRDLIVEYEREMGYR